MDLRHYNIHWVGFNQSLLSARNIKKETETQVEMVLCSSYSSETMNSSREFPIFHGLRVGNGP